LVTFALGLPSETLYGRKGRKEEEARKKKYAALGSP
jgi:hypothetical protein